MFEDLQKKPDKVDDIFAETDSPAGSNPLPANNQRPANFRPAGQGNEMPKMNVKQERSFDDSFASTEKKGGGIIKKMFILIIILALIGIGAYFVYSRILLPSSSLKQNTLVQNQGGQDLSSQSQDDLMKDNNLSDDVLDNESLIDDFAPMDNDLAPIEDDFSDNLIDEGQVEDGFPPIGDTSEEDSANEVLKNLDSDGDGLSDYDEIYIYHTDPYNHDSDNDNLSDYDEIMIFGTDPLSADTDGDTYFDGQEILNGYNPLGSGVIDVSLFKNEELFRANFADLVEKFSL